MARLTRPRIRIETTPSARSIATDAIEAATDTPYLLTLYARTASPPTLGSAVPTKLLMKKTRITPQSGGGVPVVSGPSSSSHRHAMSARSNTTRPQDHRIHD